MLILGHNPLYLLRTLSLLLHSFQKMKSQDFAFENNMWYNKLPKKIGGLK